jgi:hypothetical protein
MAFNYARIAANAALLLQKFGAQCTLRQTTAGTYDNATGTVAQTTSDETRFAALFDFGPGTINVRGNLVQMKDKRAYMEPGIVPTLADLLIAADGVKVFDCLDRRIEAGHYCRALRFARASGVMANGSKFSLDLSKAIAKAKDKADLAVRKIVLDVGMHVVSLTPVGDATLWKHPAPKGYIGGRARGSWQHGVGSVPGCIDPHH